ncbi:DNA polymerase III subunit beta [Rhodococcus qingshengii]|uniref:DNA polymerase III subunit beta n=1 Tax=Rhodococcus TaxID=1827 RepID=UPI001E40D8EA|nr:MULTISPECIES: DNA polymerase III subunit beta [Rhodococcus]MCD2099598.1 DNA polymerase III subunit beta [Rhodococcus rhodochrous]MCD2123966.1 DNA polymerase III subunit beta [Rhodococcus rhodochrous]MCQ4136603.1 DNA polymerase III subunit beta [Rhodococcus rhodochrous]MDJ0490612.1 DNA polymerase III subunit beta [Rhodococcus qingshengii]
MKFRIDRQGFADAVTTVARRLPNRPAVPVLAGVRLTATDSLLEVAGFDYEVSTVVHAQADVLDDGVVIVSGKLLADITKALPHKPVEVTYEGSTVRIVCGTAKFSLPTLNTDDYPKLPAMPQTTGELPVDLFAEAVTQVATAAGKDESLPMLTAIKTHVVDGVLTLAATDRFRLAVRKVTEWSDEIDALLPARTLGDVARTLPAGLSTVGFGADAGLWGVDTGSVHTTMRMLDVEFPQYQRLIPTEHSSVALVDVASLVSVVKRAGLVAERGAQVRLSFTQGQVTVSAGGSDAGSAEESLPVDYVGEDLTIGFNPGYLLDGLHTITVERVLFGFTTSARPATLRPYDGDLNSLAAGEGFIAPNTDFVYLIMPVRLAT